MGREKLPISICFLGVMGTHSPPNRLYFSVSAGVPTLEQLCAQLGVAVAFPCQKKRKQGQEGVERG